MEKAGAGTRLVSYIIDAIILWVIGAILGFIFMAIGAGYGVASSIIVLLISIGYFTYFFGNGQTPGMKVMKIKLCGTDGTYPIGYGKGFVRWIGMLISALVIYIGFLWILIDKDKQGWHDKIADTYVVVE
ncbi:putative membrane protein YckC, RDD family [Methanophagales archaeon]|nr:putative membrane protein YckC, RDD family [Methanophagales archaeon]